MRDRLADPACPVADRGCGYRAQLRGRAASPGRAGAGRHMTSEVTDTSRSEPPPAAGELAWHTLGADQVLRSEGVDGQRGLSSAEAAARAQQFGPNEFAAGQAAPPCQGFLPS